MTNRFLLLLFILAILTSLKSNAQANVQDSLALVNFYNSTHGKNWTIKWNLNQPVNTWYGVGIYSGRVVSLDLGGNHLAGTLPPDIEQLSKLTALNLFENQLSGTIPASISQLKDLQYLVLYSNQLTGSIPSLSQMPLLQRISLFNNQLSGNIPAFGQSPILTEIDLRHNQLTGSIPSLTQLSSLRILWLGNNQLRGNIPAWFNQMITIEELSLEHNQLTGKIPAELGQMNSLGVLMIDSNQLTGSIPSSLGQLTHMSVLYLNNNQLSGRVPSSLGQLNNLSVLYLNNNKFSGSIPSQLGQLKSLSYLLLDHNQFSGFIPAALGNLPILQELHLNNNKLTGSIPSSFGQLNHLGWLALSNNQLSGSIPSSLGKLGSLSHLLLDHNQLTSNIPSSLNKLYLIDFYANDNQLTGNVPSGLGQFSTYWWLNYSVMPTYVLSNNRFDFTSLEQWVANYQQVHDVLTQNAFPPSDIPVIVYAPQATIPLHYKNNKLSLSAGGTLANDTFRLYRNGVLKKLQVADSVFSITTKGIYAVTVTNSIVTNSSDSGAHLILYSDTLTFADTPHLLPAHPVEAFATSASGGLTALIYPNPVRGNLILHLNSDKSRQVRITVLDANGKTVLSKETQLASGTSIQTFNVSALSNGIYYIRCIAEKYVMEVKFIKA